MSPINLESIEEAFTQCLDDLERGESTIEESLVRYSQYEKELDELLALVGSLNSLGKLAPRSAFVANARQILIQRLPDREKPFHQSVLRMWQASISLFQKRLSKVYFVFIIILTFFVLMVGGIYAADAAEPGDLLYSYDRILEQLQLDLAPNTEDVVKTRLEHATERLEEAQHKLDEGEIDNAIEALSSYGKEITILAGLEGNAEAVDQDVLSKLLNTARTTHIDVLTELLTRFPERDQAAIAIKHAIEVSNPEVDVPGGPSKELPEDVPAGPPEDVGPPENVPSGPPEGVGSPQDTPSGSPEEVPANPPKDVSPPENVPSEPPEGVGPPEDAPSGPPEDVPDSLPEDVGLPENILAGPPEGVGLPEEGELPEELPDNTPENIGPPDGRP
jgi:hypothetical protein